MAGDTERSRKRVRYSAADGPSTTSKPIVVRVGESKQEFYIHQSLLCANSEFFDNALKKEWKEGQEAAVDLPETEADNFSIWVKFLYTGRVFIEHETDKNAPILGSANFQELATWESLYAVADFIQDSDFKDALIDAMIEWMTIWRRYPTELASYIYPHSKHDSLHRRLAVDTFVNVWQRKHMSEKMSHPLEFLQDVIKAIAPNLRKGIADVNVREWFKGLDGCKYHDHGDKPCYKTKPAFRF